MKCPSSEKLLEFISIPRDLPALRRWRLRTHIGKCTSCEKKIGALESKVNAYFSEEPDITSSLLKVYSRLQRDETLILKGWKLGDIGSQRSLGRELVYRGWLFRGAVVVGLGAIFAAIWITPGKNPTFENPSTVNTRLPYAQIRMEEKNRVQVHYVRPELLQSIEFETTR